MKRQFTCVAIDPTDTFCYVGTKTGDVLEVSSYLFANIINCHFNLNEKNRLILNAPFSRDSALLKSYFHLALAQLAFYPMEIL
jgi:hypothetical protein